MRRQKKMTKIIPMPAHAARYPAGLPITLTTLTTLTTVGILQCSKPRGITPMQTAGLRMWTITVKNKRPARRKKWARWTVTARPCGMCTKMGNLTRGPWAPSRWAIVVHCVCSLYLVLVQASLCTVQRVRFSHSVCSIVFLTLPCVFCIPASSLAPESEASKAHPRLSKCGKKPTCPSGQIAAPV